MRAPGAVAIPKPPGVVRQFFLTHPRLSDLLVVLVYLGWAVLLSIGRDGGPPLWVIGTLALVGAASLLVRRTRPLLAFAASGALLLVSGFVGTFSESLLPLLAVYAVAVYRSSRAAWACFGLGAVASVGHGALVGFGIGVGPWVAAAVSPEGVETNAIVTWANNAVPAVVLLLVATLIGTNVGGRVRYVAALLDRAAQLERERDQQATIAGAQERERIAREMHDVIAHSLSVMIALSEGAHASVPNRPDEARVAMGRAAETGRRTLTEVRRLLGSVRAAPDDASTESAPQPGVGQLMALSEEFARAGLPVRLDLSGTPAEDTALGLTVYRIVQESLTNALRHATGAREVRARVSWSVDSAEIVVEDDAPHRSGDGDAGGDVGRGLLGIRERAALYGGEAEAGPRDGTGWRVSVRLPRKDEDS
ncbi:sensor histidine kinase [Labedella endophytica]|nr:histidine kinase [Labedella endophytica]